MNEKLLKFKERLQGNRLNFNRKLITFSFFLIISSTFWILNALSKEYITVLNYPVEYKNFPNNKLVTGELPSSLQLRVKGYGFTLLQYKMIPVLKPIIFNVKSFALKKLYDDNHSDFYILTSSSEQQIQNQIKYDITILKIQPDTLYFNLDDVVSKKVPIKSKIKVSFEQQYMLSKSIDIFPDSITITGSESVLDTTFYIYTKNYNFRNLNSSIRRNVGLEKIDNIKYSNNRVAIELLVEKYTESQIEIPINIRNLPDSLELIIFPENVSINFKVVLSRFNNINESQFDASVNFDDVEFSLSNKLKVKLLEYPKDILSIDYSPKNIEYILKK